MDKKTTRILFSIDKNVNPQNTIDAALQLSKSANLSLTYVVTSDSYDITKGMDQASFKAEFKRTYFKDIEFLKEDGSFWKTLGKIADENDCNMIVIGANCVKPGLLGGGMSASVEGYKSAVLYLNENTQWVMPKTIMMPLDGQSETRQKFYRVAEWSKIMRANVHIFGVSSPSDKEDARYVHAYSLQGQVYMEERKLKASIEEVSSKNCASVILEKSETLKPCWISAVSNTEGIFKTSAFQKVCEKSKVPILIMPFREISGMGGVGY